ncbi:unnamed protein product, partial [Rotaria sordida]
PKLLAEDQSSSVFNAVNAQTLTTIPEKTITSSTLGKAMIVACVVIVIIIIGIVVSFIWAQIQSSSSGDPTTPCQNGKLLSNSSMSPL